MKGCTFKRKYGSGKVVWGYSVDVGRDAAGNRIRPSKSGFKREADAAEAMRKVMYQLDAGELVKADPTVYSDFLADWFSEYAERNCSPKTVERYRQLAAYATPHIGQVKLKDITALMLQRVFNELRDRGGHHRKTKESRPLSAKTVRNIASVIHSSLETAVEWDLIRSNPCTKKTIPKLKRREGTMLDASQVAWYLDTARAYGLYEFLLINSATGCRRGELLALTWPDVDFALRQLRISKSLEQTKAGLRIKETKNDKPRVIPLPASAFDVLESLKAAQKDNRDYIGKDYRFDLDLVFCTPEGNFLKPDSISAKASLIAKKAGLNNASLHTLRHAHGSLLLSKGVPLPVVSKRLGHSSTYVTATVYSHALPKDEIEAADMWEAIVQTQNQAERNRPPS